MKTFLKNIGRAGKKIGSAGKKAGLIIVDKLRRHPIMCNVVLSILMTIILETLGRQRSDFASIFQFADERTKMFLYSILIMFLSYSIVLVVKRRLFTYIVVTLLWSVVGIVNWMMLNTRNTPFTYDEIYNWVEKCLKEEKKRFNYGGCTGDIDSILIACIIYRESRFRYDSQSYVGATGLMQIMPLHLKNLKKLGKKNIQMLLLYLVLCL